MTDREWEILLASVRGEALTPAPTAFIIDSPWLPNWAGMTLLDYYTSNEGWFQANLRATQEFPDCIFLPGFWPEYGMCTEPSAFGCRCLFPENEFPFAEKVIEIPEEIDRLKQPDPRNHGLLPFVIKRLRHCLSRIENAGHRLRFAISRGPLNIASFLMGTTEFLTAMRDDPGRVHRLLRLITEFAGNWLEYQRECFPTIDGILLLDDIVGFIGESDFRAFALPYLRKLMAESGAAIRLFHNDAPCRRSAPYLAEAGINLFNMGSQARLQEIREWCGPDVAVMGNVPPRDVLAAGSPADVETAVREQYRNLQDTRRVVFSCGGGMPPGVSGENIRAFIRAVSAMGQSATPR